MWSSKLLRTGSPFRSVVCKRQRLRVVMKVQVLQRARRACSKRQRHLQRPYSQTTGEYQPRAEVHAKNEPRADQYVTNVINIFQALLEEPF